LYAVLPYNFLEYTRMNWNPYKRIAALEREVIDLREQARHLNVRLDLLRSVISKPYAAAPVRSEGEPVHTEAEVASVAEQKREKHREYQRKYYQRKKIKEKRREYQRNYYHQKKADKAAEQAVGGTE